MRQRDHRWLPFIKRRALIAFLAGVVAFPTIANAQLAKERRIGVLSSFGESDPVMRSGLAVFRQRLEELGWQGGHIEIEYRWAAGNIDRLHTLAKELVVDRPDVLLATGNGR